MFAAGSLRFALDDAIAAYTARTGVPVVAPYYGPSGKLRQMIESGDVPGQFGSASLDHAAALKHVGVLRTSEPFTRSGHRLMVAPGISVERGKVVEVMLDPALRLGSATPKSDHAGDCAWETFRKVDKLRPGAYAKLDAKAPHLTGKDRCDEGQKVAALSRALPG